MGNRAGAVKGRLDCSDYSRRLAIIEAPIDSANKTTMTINDVAGPIKFHKCLQNFVWQFLNRPSVLLRIFLDEVIA